MSSVSQWYWDGEWHPYPKNKQPPLEIKVWGLHEWSLTAPWSMEMAFLQSGNLGAEERKSDEQGNHTGRVHNPPKTVF